MAGSFTIMFRNSLDRKDVNDVDELSFLAGEIRCRYEPGGDWCRISSLTKQTVPKEVADCNIDYPYKLFSVSDGVAGKGRYSLAGIDTDGAEHIIWDNVELVQGDKEQLYVYAYKRSRGFALEWLPAEGGWRFRDDRLEQPEPELQGPLYVEVRLARYQPSRTAPRVRLSALAEIASRGRN